MKTATIMSDQNATGRSGSALTAGQLPLDLPAPPPRYDRAMFVRAEANDSAWRTGEAWLASGEPALAVCGPSGAGKTHFVHALLESHEARVIEADRFASLPASAGLTFIDAMPATDPYEFLTAFESGIAASGRFVLAGEGRPSDWAMGLKDLRTRLEAAPRAVLCEPDEALIRAVIAKGFRDRQIAVSQTVIDYAAPRMPRTFAAARLFVAMADRAAMVEKRKITAPFIQKILDNLSEGEFPA